MMSRLWPKVPIDGSLRVGLPTKNKPLSRSEKSLFDQYGGQWRPHLRDGKQGHNLHWNYQSSTKYAKWLDIPINNMPTLRKGLQYVKN